jgi:hypothetical protein
MPVRPTSPVVESMKELAAEPVSYTKLTRDIAAKNKITVDAAEKTLWSAVSRGTFDVTGPNSQMMVRVKAGG